MKCDEVQPLQGPYLDSELDARTTFDIQEHLKSCRECARLFAEGQRFETWMTAGLKQGQRSASLWEETERAVVQATVSSKHSEPSPLTPNQVGQAGLFAALNTQLRNLWRQAPRTWSGIAVAWLVILFLNLNTRDTETVPVAQQMAPSAAEMHFALKQKQSLMAELTVAAETIATSKTKTAVPRPRSQRQESNLKT